MMSERRQSTRNSSTKSKINQENVDPFKDASAFSDQQPCGSQDVQKLPHKTLMKLPPPTGKLTDLTTTCNIIKETIDKEFVSYSFFSSTYTLGFYLCIDSALSFHSFSSR